MKIFNEQKICDFIWLGFHCKWLRELASWPNNIACDNQQPGISSILYSISVFRRCKWDKRFDRNYFESCVLWIHWAKISWKVRSGTDVHITRKGKWHECIVVMKIWLLERLSKLPVFAKIIVRKVFDESINVFWRRWNYSGTWVTVCLITGNHGLFCVCYD